ncbi:MAG: hypothetical protein JWP66_24 [Naasia sp.]|nr:hypothetical protein [Naasia sp.]
MDEKLLTIARLRAQGEERPERRAGENGDLQRLRRGIYADAGEWQTANLDERYAIRIAAAAARLEGLPVFSHESALRLLGLPSLRPWPEKVHILCERRSGGRSQLDVIRHCLGFEAAEVLQVGRHLVTSPARTALDIALARSFPEGVVVADHVFRNYAGARQDFAEMLELTGPRARGVRKAASVLRFADERSESPGESWSRVVIAELGFRPPELQSEIRHRGRFIGRVDFEWTDRAIVGEFDGEWKYRSAELRAGRTAEQVVVEEKDRENRIRRVRADVVRWTWADLRDRRRLEALLGHAGVPRIAL